MLILTYNDILKRGVHIRWTVCFISSRMNERGLLKETVSPLSLISHHLAFTIIVFPFVTNWFSSSIVRYNLQFSFTPYCLSLPLYVIIHCLSYPGLSWLSVIIFYLVFPIFCQFPIVIHSRLTVISHCLQFPIFFHPLLSVISIVCNLLLSAIPSHLLFPFVCHFPLSIISNWLSSTVYVIPIVCN